MMYIWNVIFLVGYISIKVDLVYANVWTVDCTVLTTQRMDPIVFQHKHPAGRYFKSTYLHTRIYYVKA